MSQKQQIVEHLKSGKSITQLEATKLYGITRLAPIIHTLRREEGLPIKNREQISERTGNIYVAYFLNGADVPDEHPTLFDEQEEDAQKSDGLDTSATALQPGNPPKVGGTEMFAHHIANPEDTSQILASFRAYCEQFGGKPVEITPDWARQLLKLNRSLPLDSSSDLKRNRQIKKKKLEKFKRHFNDGTFICTNVGLGFDEDGWLIDGQTRLTASVETGKTFYAGVTFDMPREAFAILDSHDSARRNADFAYMSGIEHYSKEHVAAAAIVYRRDHKMGHTEGLSQTEIVDAIRAYRDIDKSVALAMGMKRKLIPGPRAIIAAVHYLASKINKSVADKAFEDLKTGAVPSTTDPVLVARNRLISAYSSSPNEFTGVGDKRVRVLLSRMFNYRLAGKTTSAFLLAGGDDWPGDPVRPQKSDTKKPS